MNKILIGLLFYPLITENNFNHTQKTINPMVVKIRKLASSNKFKPNQRIINAIISASNKYKINALDLTAVAIVESGLGKYSRSTPNRDGTFDKGLFQINTINQSVCKRYNLDTIEGSSFCAALLISRHKKHHKDYLGVYHSKTPSKKILYLKKIAKVFQNNTDKNMRRIALIGDR